MNGLGLQVFRWSSGGLCFACFFVWCYAVTSNPESVPYRYYHRYVAHLDCKLRSLLLPIRGQWIVVGQVFLIELAGMVCVAAGDPRLYLILLATILGPAFCLEYMRRRRVQKLETQIDGFMLTLANALRATPNIGSALGYSVELLPKPMSQEVGLAVQELRFGTGIDQALLHMGGRVQSASLDSTLLAVLVGRQVGGNLTKVLESTATTLREMARLQRTLRAKTAESKGQMLVLAVFPFAVWYGFDRLYPGHFDPLFASPMGRLVLVGAALLWLGSLLVARHILAVEL